jgi:hypothetical protein
MCRYLAIAIFAPLALSGCVHQRGAREEPKPTVSQEASVETETAALVGTWGTALPDEPDQTAQIVLGTDERWSLWPASKPAYTGPKKPSQAGTWFVRKGKVFLLVDESESDKIIPGMTFAFDIKTVSSDTAVVLWGGREVRCRRIR